jgi:hypothetical protein
MSLLQRSPLPTKINSVQGKAELDLVEVANSTSLAYLDLVVHGELKSSLGTLDYLDLASTVPKFESAFVFVCSGE